MKADPLKTNRAEVAAAEAALDKARDKMSAAAERLGISHHALFAGSDFVKRSTAEAWSKKATREGAAEIIGGIRHLRDSGYLLLRTEIDPHEAIVRADQMLADLIIAAGKKARGES